MLNKVWDEITYSFVNLNGAMAKKFHLMLYNVCNYLPLLRVKLTVGYGFLPVFKAFETFAIKLLNGKIVPDALMRFNNQSTVSIQHF